MSGLSCQNRPSLGASQRDPKNGAAPNVTVCLPARSLSLSTAVWMERKAGVTRARQFLAFARQGHPANRPVEQAMSQGFFQRPDLVTDRGGGEIQFLRCRLEARVPGGGLEGAQRDQ